MLILRHLHASNNTFMLAPAVACFEVRRCAKTSTCTCRARSPLLSLRAGSGTQSAGPREPGVFGRAAAVATERLAS